jgi:hypothetical protein
MFPGLVYRLTNACNEMSIFSAPESALRISGAAYETYNQHSMTRLAGSEILSYLKGLP